MVSSEDDLLSYLESLITRTLHDVGLDAYLLKEKAFTREKYYSALKKYEEIFISGKVGTKENIDATFKYIVYYFKNNLELLEYTDMALRYIYDYYMVVKEQEDVSQYKYVNEFMSYIDEHELGQQLELK